MSDNFDRLLTYIERLREQAKVEENDVRYRHYAEYINAFASLFCKEKIYLVGSTGESSKLRWSKNGGDTDFLLCSGMFEIPVENLMFRKQTPCYVWLQADGLKSKIKFDLIDDKYIPTDLLRSVSPELFTILRGIYLIGTSNLDTVRGRKSRVTTTGLPSRVGLARQEYRNLNISDERIPDPRVCRKKSTRPRTENAKTTEKYGKDVVIHQKDKEMVDWIISMIVLGKKPGSSGSNDGEFRNFAHVMDIVRKRRQGCQVTKTGECEDEGAVNDTESHRTIIPGDAEGQSTSEVKGNRAPTTKPDPEELKQKSSDVDCTYEKRKSKDFVPAIRIKGRLQLMDDWEKRGGCWPKIEDRQRISKCEVFVVSRYAPISPDIDKDFCLSFNLAELELARCMSQAQKDIFLILKSYLKGGFQVKKDSVKPEAELKLTTFHLKTALYWVSEKENPDIWQENIEVALRKVLNFITEAVNKGCLKHYFVPKNNLFADLVKEDLDLINECINEIADPIQYIKRFFDLDDGKPVKIKLTEDELSTLLEIREDGGLEKEADLIEEAIIDFHRGFNEGPRDANGNAPIVDAIQKTVERYLQVVERGQLPYLKKKLHLAKITLILTILKYPKASGILFDFIGKVKRSRLIQPIRAWDN